MGGGLVVLHTGVRIGMCMVLAVHWHSVRAHVRLRGAQQHRGGRKPLQGYAGQQQPEDEETEQRFHGS